MSSSPVDSSRVIKTLCDHQGCLDFKRLHEIIVRLPDGDSLLRSVLSDDRKVVIKRGDQEATGGQLISPDSLVLAKTSLRVCVKKPYSQWEKTKKPTKCQCDSLHLCRLYVRGNCTFGDKCNDPHSLAEPYNAEILKKHGLQDLTEKQLFQLLLQNDPQLLPEICAFYNTGLGGSCTYGTNCRKLHVCKHYFQGACNFGISCRRSHKINEQGMELLRGCSEETIKSPQEIYRKKFLMSLWGTPGSVLPEAGNCAQKLSHNNSGSSSGLSSKPTSGADNNEICLYSIRRCCKYGEKCRDVHWHLPYRWQVLDTDAETWKDLPNMEDTEMAYCDPEYDTYQLPSSLQSSASAVAQAVNFMTMTYEGSPVRRLSTASSVSKPPHFILTTQWLWYWKDETGKWTEFGQGDGDTPASVTSETREKKYLADRDAEIPFSAGNHQYILHFKGKPGTPQMYRENLEYKTKREVRRRPRFVSANDVKMKVESASSSSTSSSTAESCPPNWDRNALPDDGYKLVPLSISMEDYRKIKWLFEQTMPQGKINSIQRIQNRVLWDKFQRQKKLMKLRNGGTDVNHLPLFHGTDQSLIEAICKENLDWRRCGVHCTAYGKGSYFAKDASYSDTYASIPGSTNKIMFVAQVLVGEYCRGGEDIPLPPLKGNSKLEEQSQTRYDSCVDDESDPRIYVIFEKDQIYPEYIINYS